MTHQSLTAVIETLQPPPAASDLDQLAQLLMGAVDSGAGVSSVLPFSVTAAAEWWPTMLERADPRAGVSENLLVKLGVVSHTGTGLNVGLLAESRQGFAEELRGAGGDPSRGCHLPAIGPHDVRKA